MKKEINYFWENKENKLEKAKRPSLIKKFINILKEQNFTPLDNIIDFFNILINEKEAGKTIILVYGFDNAKLFKSKLTKEFDLNVRYILEENIKDSAVLEKLENLNFKTRKNIKILEVERRKRF